MAIGELRLLMGLMVLPMVGLSSCGYLDQGSQETTLAPVKNVTRDVPPLVKATLSNDVSTVKKILQRGGNPNVLYHTNTSLTYAARDGFTEIARLLLEHGADANWIDGEGVTPLILASFKGHREIVQLLLAHGADTTVRDQWNRTALDYALRRGETDPIAQLLTCCH